MLIELNEAEIALGGLHGAKRVAKKMVAGFRPLLPNNCPDDEIWEDQIEGALGEIAVAKALGIEWDPGYAGAYDVGGFDVRQTTFPNGHLLVQTWDKPRTTILVTGRFGKYNVRGFMHNQEAKDQKYWRGNIPRPCFWVPQSDLIPFTTMQSLEDYDKQQQEKFRCAVRQLLLYYKEMGASSYSRYLDEKKIDKQLSYEAREQYKKGNRGDEGVWFD